MSKVEVINLYKVFGIQPQSILPMIKKGASKRQVMEETGHTVGINNVSFQVEQGEIFVIMGLSGCGKSTLVRCINRLIEPTAGEIRIDGENIIGVDPNRLLEIRRKKVAMVFQRFGLLPHRDVCSNVEYGLEIQGVDPAVCREKALQTIELVGLKGYEFNMPSQLSGGMQQRVGLARALATEPDILLMDEAFSALDPLIRREMQEELLELQAKMSKTIIFITHDLDEALRLGDRIAVMRDGQIVQIGNSEEILTHPADDYVRAFVQDVDRTKVLTASSIMKRPDPLVIPKDGPRAAVRRMQEEGISSLYVVDSQRRFHGIVRIEDVTRLVHQEIHNLEEVIVKDVPIANPNMQIIELLPIAFNAKTPIVVLDDQNKMRGIIRRAAVISSIMGEEK
ncbi:MULTISPECIES: quaternary amine ABC transporter ATP-binding protein [Pelosinus]|uniref:Quaternary amine transport ATP-binding protein n=1 Tax=Pelosinus fermentans B4 TaxID=1149862 RepID=I9L620_9FIRM|nr:MULTISPECIES: glycine betaine/L-proline ABC transporter ATP-binding protein [Pelosinus]EIW15691.1 glycine betaine/L-proline ABC transporter, ATPase subunit [Pelosinus fermentans B4]EIW26619.1 glycine betaine/L-proline ABC transporter, ATPase subunit [Pelosinus fermentans A11]OAM92436.1 glycine betaine/L-proline ABC transporter, ATPase subunit [Pelosinus fermentans DSM 17108]SDQ44818.1 glycine betaine/proline transport system ATP-binding protein [Pelosinus fermentans]